MILITLGLLACAPGADAGLPATGGGCTVVLDPGDTGTRVITAFAASSDGRMAWSEGFPGHAVHIRNRSGVTAVSGTDGDGPGDFRSVNRLGWHGDSLWVSDDRLGRVTWLRRDGLFLQGRDLAVQGSFVPVGGDTVVGALVAPEDSEPMRFVVRALASRPGRLDTLIAVQGHDASMVEIEDGDDGYRMAARPFVEQAFAAVSPDGRWACGIEPADSSGTIHLSCRAPDGRASIDTLLTFEPVRPSDADYAAVVDRLGVTMPEVSRNAIEAAIPRPSRLPTASGFLVANGGQVWVRRSSARELAEAWDRFRPDDGRIDRVTLPPGHDVLSVRGDTAFTRVADSLGIQHVERCVAGSS